MKKNKLLSIMSLHGENGGLLANYLGIARTTFSAKLNETNGAEFTQGEICMIKKHYGLSAFEVDDIFFAEEVSSQDTLET